MQEGDGDEYSILVRKIKKGRDHFGDTAIDGRIILKWFRTRMYRLNSSC
jgi:hypothetical protein